MKSFLLIPGEFHQCSWATLNYNGDPSLAFCEKFWKIMDGWTVINYCRSNKIDAEALVPPCIIDLDNKT